MILQWGPESMESATMQSQHDDVINWNHFPRYWPFVRGIHRSPVNSPHKGQWRGALMFSLICTWTNSWGNNGNAGELRRHRAHYDVTVMNNDSAMRSGKHGIQHNTITETGPCFHDDAIKWKHFPRYWLLWGEFTGHRWIPRTKASELWCFLWSASELTVEPTMETLVIWDAIALIMAPQ